MISILQLATLVAVLYVSAINEGECFLWPVPVECGKNEVSTTYQCPFNKCCIQKEYRLMYCYSSHTTSCECKNGYSRSIEGECIETKECEKDNDNVKECIKRCKGKPEMNVCQQKHSNSGCSDGWKYLYYYDRNLRSCRISSYGCCGENRFETLKECQNTCPETQEDCGPNEIYVPSMSPCNNCEKKGNCSGYFVQQAGCDCKKGFYRESDNKSPCIPEKKCPKNNKCKEHEKWDDCGTACPAICGVVQNKLCINNCVPGCFCENGYIKNQNGKCISQEECYSNCGPNEKYVVGKSRCNNCIDKNNCSPPFVPVSGCQCIPGYFRAKKGDDSSPCIPERECEGPEPDICEIEPKKCPCSSNNPYPYFYDHASKSCKRFSDGCGENKNSFGSMKKCEETCMEKEPDVCKVEPKECSCDRINTKKYYYDNDSKSCEKFNNNKCGENDNSFGSMDECEKICKDCPPPPDCGHCDLVTDDPKLCPYCKCDDDH